MINYTCISKGDTISISHEGRDYKIDIIDCQPSEEICISDAKFAFDFEAALDSSQQVPSNQVEVNENDMQDANEAIDPQNV